MDFGIIRMTIIAAINYDSVSTRCFIKIVSSNPLNNSMRHVVPLYSFTDKEIEI